nr:immunoglobulin light chain junction region [Macaca mulatta]
DYYCSSYAGSKILF